MSVGRGADRSAGPPPVGVIASSCACTSGDALIKNHGPSRPRTPPTTGCEAARGPRRAQPHRFRSGSSTAVSLPQPRSPGFERARRNVHDAIPGRTANAESTTDLSVIPVGGNFRTQLHELERRLGPSHGNLHRERRWGFEARSGRFVGFIQSVATDPVGRCSWVQWIPGFRDGPRQEVDEHAAPGQCSRAMTSTRCMWK